MRLPDKVPKRLDWCGKRDLSIISSTEFGNEVRNITPRSILRELRLDILINRFDTLKGNPTPPEKRQSIHSLTTMFCHLTHFAKLIHAYHYFTFSNLFFGTCGVYHSYVTTIIITEAHTKRVVEQVQFDGLPFANIPDNNVFAVNCNIRPTKMLQCGVKCNTRNVQNIPVMCQNVDICANMEAFGTDDQAK